jgi:hypothetical protein
MNSNDKFNEEIDHKKELKAAYNPILRKQPPAHYKTSNDFDVIDICKAYNLNFNRGNILKYICRAGKKEDELKDLKKALDYLQRELKHLQE